MVVITFGNGTSPAFTDAQLQGVLVSNPNSVSNYFDEQSYGAVTFTGINNPNGDVYHATIAAIPDSSCDWSTWGSEATAAVGASTLNQYDHVIYVFDSGGRCGFAGLGYMPGRTVYIDHYFQLSVVAHELGHNLGVHHASSLRCTVGGVAVAYSTASGACTSSEYGDPFDIMGSSATNEQNAFHKLQSGWLGGLNGGRVQTITQTGDYTVGPLESSTGTALLLIPNVTGGVLGQDFALDFRQPTGTYFDNYASNSSAVGGVQIRLVQTPGGAPIQTQLIDANPSTTTFSDAALASGETFTDATDSITIQTTNVSPFGATVHVTVGSGGSGSSGSGSGGSTIDTTPPTAVSALATTIESGPAVTISFGPATDAGGIASYQITRDGATIATLGSAATAYVDWTATPGNHTYGVTATDIAGNVGPLTTVLATVPAPVVVTPTKPASTTPTTGNGGTNSSDGSDDDTDGVTKIFKQIRLAKGVSLRVLAHNGRTRRVEVTWTKVAGTHTYTVMRNGLRVATTRSRTWSDPKAPAGALRYTIRVS